MKYELSKALHNLDRILQNEIVIRSSRVLFAFVSFVFQPLIFNVFQILNCCHHDYLTKILLCDQETA